MIRLKNVRIKNNRIYADYYPEDSVKGSVVSTSLDNSDDFQGNLAGDSDIETKGHLGHARVALREMAEGKRKKEDTVIMWY